MELKEIVAKLPDLIEQRDDLQLKLKEINIEIANLCHATIPYVAKHLIGDRIEKRGSIYEITRISASLKTHRPTELYYQYYGRKVLKDGKSLHKNEQSLYWVGWETA